MTAKQDLMSLIKQAGFTGQSAETMYAIVMAESGGSATAHNTNAGTGDNSYGLAQINMLGSMGPSRRQEYGLSSNNDLFDPLTNLKVAYAMSGHGTNFAPWSTYNSGAYRTYLGQSGAQVTNGDHTAVGPGPSGGPSGNVNYHNIDSLGALLNQVPELRHLIDQATSNNWSAAKFQNEVEDSQWWQDHSATARSILVQQANDPASYSQTFTNTKQSIASLSRHLGMDLNAGQLEAIATSALLSGNSSNQEWLTRQISRREDYSGVSDLGGLQGGMAATSQQLQQLAGDYGFKWSPSDVAVRAQNVLDGSTTMDTYRQRLQTWAASAFPSLAQQIQSGATVKDLADPYVQSMSQLLEVDPGTLSVYTPKIRQALQGSAGKNGQLEATPLWQFEKQVRSDPRWSSTQNAMDTMSSALVNIGDVFGFGPGG